MVTITENELLDVASNQSIYEYRRGNKGIEYIVDKIDRMSEEERRSFHELAITLYNSYSIAQSDVCYDLRSTYRLIHLSCAHRDIDFKFFPY